MSLLAKKSGFQGQQQWAPKYHIKFRNPGPPSPCLRNIPKKYCLFYAFPQINSSIEHRDRLAKHQHQHHHRHCRHWLEPLLKRTEAFVALCLHQTPFPHKEEMFLSSTLQFFMIILCIIAKIFMIIIIILITITRLPFPDKKEMFLSSPLSFYASR